MKKRGQAATEFLTTYGWAILILMIVIGLLVGLNIFNPKIPNSCIGSDPVSCQDVKLTAPNQIITLALTASGISTTQSTQVMQVILNTPQIAPCITGLPVPLTNNAQTAVNCGFAPGTVSEGNKFTGTATITYYLPNSVTPYTSKTIFSGTVEP